MTNKPIIKLNGGNPVALCEKCRTIIDYVTYIDDEPVLRKTQSEIPLFCNSCNEKKAVKKAIATIKSCTTIEHLDGAHNFIDSFLNEYKNYSVYYELVELLKETKKKINKN